MLENNASAEKAMKTIKIGLLMSLKQHSSKHESTQSMVCSSYVQSSQKLAYEVRKGMSNAIDTRSVTTVRMREINPRVCRKVFIPMSNSNAMASISDNIPTANPSRCGSGPLNSTDIQVMMVERRTIDEMR